MSRKTKTGLSEPPKKIPAVIKNRFKARILEEVNTDNPEVCWEWAGTKTVCQYGILTEKRSAFRVHRVAYEIWVGKTNGLCVLHKCDNPKCFNPNHLFLGTLADNMKDARDKGRMPNSGEDHPRAKLSQLDVDTIRHLYATGHYSQKSLGEMFGITQQQVSNIIREDNWGT